MVEVQKTSNSDLVSVLADGGEHLRNVFIDAGANWYSKKSKSFASSTIMVQNT